MSSGLAAESTSTTIDINGLRHARLQLALRGGLRGKPLRAALTELTTQTVTQVWKQALAKVRIADPDDLCLAAVGSLARGECGPVSDLDLVLLHSGRAAAPVVGPLSQALWYPLWDAGLRVDHSVRTPHQCRQVANVEVSAAVGLLDLTPIAGAGELATTTRTALLAAWRGQIRRQLPHLQLEVATRLTQHGEVAYLLEPDLKQGAGGLRDATVMRAVVASWVADRPHGAVDLAYQRLLDIRDALQVVTGRGTDRLLLNDADAVAAALGLVDADALASQVAHSGRTIAHALAVTMRRAQQATAPTTRRWGSKQPPRPVPLSDDSCDEGLGRLDSEVVVTATPAQRSDPSLPLRAAAAASERGLLLSTTTVHVLGGLTEQTPLPVPWPQAARDAWVRLLAGPGVVATWESLQLAGLIEQWLPAWSGVANVAQRTPVHRYTVDRHQVQTVAELRPHLGMVERPDLLLLAGLLHDVGKANGLPNHALVGAPLAERVVLEQGYAAAEAADVALLVREHLRLMELATRRDPNDPQTISDVWDAVQGRPDMLVALRYLTQADAVAAGPAAWTVWRERLVTDLVLRAQRVGPPHDTEPDSGTAAPEVTFDDLSSADRVFAMLAADGQVHVQVVVDPDDATSAAVQMVAPDRPGFFADGAGVLAALRLSVAAADIRTVLTDRGPVALDTWHVGTGSRGAPTAEAVAEQLRRLANHDRSLLDRLAGRESSARSTSTTRVCSVPPRVVLCPRASAHRTVLEVHAADRPGLLHTLGTVLWQHQINVHSAHVATFAGQAVDVLYVTERDGNKLSASRSATVIAALMDALA